MLVADRDRLKTELLAKHVPLTYLDELERMSANTVRPLAMKRPLDPEEIVQLRAEVKKAGSQGTWAKRAGIERTLVNKVLNGKRQPAKNIIRALGFRKALSSTHHSRILETEEVRRLLRTQVAQAGSLSAWGRNIGVSRPEISKALWGKRPPNKQMMDTLGLRVVIVKD